MKDLGRFRVTFIVEGEREVRRREGGGGERVKYDFRKAEEALGGGGGREVLNRGRVIK